MRLGHGRCLSRGAENKGNQDLSSGPVGFVTHTPQETRYREVGPGTKQIDKVPRSKHRRSQEVNIQDFMAGFDVITVDTQS